MDPSADVMEAMLPTSFPTLTLRNATTVICPMMKTTQCPHVQQPCNGAREILCNYHLQRTQHCLLGLFQNTEKGKEKKINGRNPRANPKRRCVKASTRQIFNSIWDGSHYSKLPISSDTHCRRARNCNSLDFGHNKLHLRRAYCCPLTNMGPPEMQTQWKNWRISSNTSRRSKFS